MPGAVDTSVLSGRRLTGRAVITSTGGTYTLSSDEALHGIIDVQGALTSNLTVVFPPVDGHVWFLLNNTSGAFSTTCKVAAGVVVNQGKTAVLSSDGATISLLGSDAAGAGAVVVAPTTSAQNTVQPTLATVTPLTLKGAVSQTDPLLAFRNAAGAVVAQVTSIGVFAGPDGSGVDQDGGDVRVAGGQSTGFGNAGQLAFQMSEPGAGAGSGANPLFNKLALNSIRSVMLVEPGSTDTLQFQSRLAADGTNTTRRVAGLAFRGAHWTGSASAFDDVLIDLNYTDTTHYQWRVVTNGQPRLWVDNSGNVTVGSAAQTGALFNVAGTVVITGASITLGEGTNFALGTGTGTKIGTSNAQRIGFFGATAVLQQTLAAAATDAATTQTLCNSIRTALINLGLGV